MRALILWIFLCAYLNCTGWVLSALHALNAGGYAVALALGLAAWLAARKHLGPARAVSWSRLRRRFRRGFPLAFLALAALAFLGGVLYAPTNYDALTYRVPRMFHWLATGQWHWIHTLFPRLNQRSCGIEWVSAPVFILSHSIRPLFLINFISFLFLPGLVFSVFTRLGVRPRVSWYWMWLAPSGYCFLLQAASLGNDLFGAFFVLSAIHFALRVRTTRRGGDFCASVLAAALMTSAKPSNLPLLLPWALAILPSAALMLRWPLRATLLATLAILASFVPTALLNIHFCGDWTGLKVETGVTAAGPLFRVATNAFLLALTNLNSPVCPFTGWWHVFFTSHVPATLAARWDHTMEIGMQTFELAQLQIEEAAGLGFGICALVAFSLLAVRIAGRANAAPRPSPWLLAVRWSPVISLLVVMSQSWVTALGREITPYYALLLPVALAPAGQAWLVRQRWWRRTAALVFALAAVPLVLSPARPLFPALTLCHHLHFLPARVASVYTVYRHRTDAFAPVKAVLEPDAVVLGFFGYDDPETSLWLPWGSRRVEHILPGDTAADMKSRGIRFLLIHPSIAGLKFDVPLETWLQQHGARIVQTIRLDLRVKDGPEDWILVRLD